MASWLKNWSFFDTSLKTESWVGRCNLQKWQLQVLLQCLHMVTLYTGYHHNLFLPFHAWHFCFAVIPFSFRPENVQACVVVVLRWMKIFLKTFNPTNFNLTWQLLRKKNPCASKKSLEIFFGTLSGVKTLCSKRTSCVALRRENIFLMSLLD